MKSLTDNFMVKFISNNPIHLIFILTIGLISISWTEVVPNLSLEFIILAFIISLYLVQLLIMKIIEDGRTYLGIYTGELFIFGVLYLLTFLPINFIRIVDPNPNHLGLLFSQFIPATFFYFFVIVASGINMHMERDDLNYSNLKYNPNYDLDFDTSYITKMKLSYYLSSIVTIFAIIIIPVNHYGLLQFDPSLVYSFLMIIMTLLFFLIGYWWVMNDATRYSVLIIYNIFIFFSFMLTMIFHIPDSGYLVNIFPIFIMMVILFFSTFIVTHSYYVKVTKLLYT